MRRIDADQAPKSVIVRGAFYLALFRVNLEKSRKILKNPVRKAELSSSSGEPESVWKIGMKVVYLGSLSCNQVDFVCKSSFFPRRM
jgi:hypothetical protein